MTDASDGEVKRSRAPRKRATRKRVESDTRESSPVSRKVAAPAPEPARKAPTPIAAKKRSQSAARNQVLVSLAIFIVGMSSSAAIGYSDKGMIDVNQKIAERNQKAAESGDTSQVIPVQNQKNNLPDGGLVGLGVGAEPPKQEEVVEEPTASTTEEVVETEATEEGQVPQTETEVAE